jgi:hypothetical protein
MEHAADTDTVLQTTTDTAHIRLSIRDTSVVVSPSQDLRAVIEVPTTPVIVSIETDWFGVLVPVGVTLVGIGVAAYLGLRQIKGNTQASISSQRELAREQLRTTVYGQLSKQLEESRRRLNESFDTWGSLHRGLRLMIDNHAHDPPELDVLAMRALSPELDARTIDALVEEHATLYVGDIDFSEDLMDLARRYVRCMTDYHKEVWLYIAVKQERGATEKPRAPERLIKEGPSGDNAAFQDICHAFEEFEAAYWTLMEAYGRLSTAFQRALLGRLLANSQDGTA